MNKTLLLMALLLLAGCASDRRTARRGLPVVHIAKDIPDRLWYGNKLRLLNDHRGPAINMIDQVDRAACRYAWPDYYRSFPGPNSITFTTWIGRQIPGLELILLFSAIGSGSAD